MGRMLTEQHALSLPTSSLLLLRPASRGGRHALRQVIAFLTVVQGQRPDDFWVNYELGACHALAEPADWDESLRWASMALAVRPDTAAAHLAVGFAFYKKGKTEEAERFYRVAIRLNSARSGAHDGLGTVLIERKQYAAAEAALRQAVRLRPDVADFHSNPSAAHSMSRGSHNLRLPPPERPSVSTRNHGRRITTSDSRSSVKASTRRPRPLSGRPSDSSQLPRMHNNLGTLLADQGNLVAAANATREAIRLRPKYPERTTTLGPC